MTVRCRSASPTVTHSLTVTHCHSQSQRRSFVVVVRRRRSFVVRSSSSSFILRSSFIRRRSSFIRSSSSSSFVRRRRRSYFVRSSSSFILRSFAVRSFVFCSFVRSFVWRRCHCRRRRRRRRGCLCSDFVWMFDRLKVFVVGSELVRRRFDRSFWLVVCAFLFFGTWLLAGRSSCVRSVRECSVSLTMPRVWLVFA